MKNLKKLSRNELKNLSGGQIINGGPRAGLEPGDCGNVCSPGNGYCEQFGLECGYYALVKGGTTTSSCFKCM